MKVLIIDDSTINNMLMENMLTAHGFESMSVIEGNRAEEYIEDYQPDVIILDLMIPDRSGLEILKALKAKDINIPVVVITAMESKDMRKKIKNLGVTEYHTKPINPAKLVESIQKVTAA